MPIRSLILNDEMRERIKMLRAKAESLPPIDLETMMTEPRTDQSRRDHLAALNRLTLTVGNGCIITYMIEDRQGTAARRMSICVDAPEKLPAPDVVRMLMPEFGFVGRLGADTQVFRERAPMLGHAEINIRQPIDHQPAPAG